MDVDWVDIDGISSQLTFPGNDEFATESISLPFDFSFFGETYDYLNVNANGWVGWNSRMRQRGRMVTFPQLQCLDPQYLVFLMT